jgi:alanyl-tRNA synthetase
MPKTVNELRESFLKYFESKGHTRERASPLIPHNDPTLLFTNSGMVQFKDLFTGKEKRKYTRATTCQKSVRAGGKHNDLESVGFTKRHHTFFEMLGNFSFGDYFKEEAIGFAWEYLTKVIGFSSDNLWVSVFENDEEARVLWKKISGLPDSRIVKMGEKDNFWAMGDTGPCGPCSEIYVDRGESYGKNETIFDGGERFLEIWNLVFMQFERFADGRMIPLPKPSVDTGMGLERLASVVQNVDNNYLIDGMQTIVRGFSDLTKTPFGKSNSTDVALKVLTDHIRACSFMIADGIQPSNEGRGYVLRRILRRAIRYGKNLGMDRPFFHQGVDFVEREMGKAYPELTQNLSAIKTMIYHEEEKFYETLENGLKLLESKTKSLKKGETLAGEVAFQLYDTFGFPLDLTEVILREGGLNLDHAGFQRELEAQRDRSRASWKGSGEQGVSEIYKELATKIPPTNFVGYTQLEHKTQVTAIVEKGSPVQKLTAGSFGDLILAATPFYAEGGGQVGDVGQITGKDFVFEVSDTLKPVKNVFVHRGKLIRGSVEVGSLVEARVNSAQRMKTRINHSVTHVLHATLAEVLGDHIKQAGSLVTPDYLRFDFTHFKALTSEEMRKIESTINARIRENHIVSTAEMNLDSAIKAGAKAFFDEKYEESVRVLTMGSFSKELCGGTHAERLGEAGLFKITSESSVASGVRRIVAVTGEKAYEEVLRAEDLIQQLREMLKSSESELPLKVEKLMKEKSDLQRKLSQQQLEGPKDIESLIQEVKGIKTIVEIKALEDVKDLRPVADQYKQKIKSGVAILAASVEGKATVIVSVTEDLAPKFDMKGMVARLSTLVQGKGGGRNDFAQIGGPDTSRLSTDSLRAALNEHIQGLGL